MIYCAKCRKPTDTLGVREVVASNKGLWNVRTCAVCGSKKSQRGVGRRTLE